MALPEEDLAAFIATALTLVVGQDIVIGPVQEPENGIKAKAVFIVPSGGRPPDDYADGTRLAIRWPDLNLYVRSDERLYSAGLVFARAIREAIIFETIPNHLPGGVQIQEAEPTYLKKDSQGRHVWIMGVTMVTEE